MLTSPSFIYYEARVYFLAASYHPFTYFIESLTCPFRVFVIVVVLGFNFLGD